MVSLSRVLSAAALLVLAGGPLCMAPAFAQNAPVAQSAPATTSVVSGLITDTAGTPVGGAAVALVGPKTYTATTDASGRYTISGVEPGVYTATVTRSGYQSGSEPDVAVVAGTPVTLNVQLAAPTLSTLRVIGSTRTVFSRSTFNSSPAAVNVISTQTFIDQGQPQVKSILNETPGIVASLPATSGNGAAPGAITFPNIRGGLSFETAALIDGHPVSVGAFGDYVTTFLSSYMLQSVEVIKGPGAAAPEVNYAIGGTVNFRTLDPTRKPSGYETYGIDSFGGSFSNVGYSNTIMNGKLGFVFDYAVDGTPGPLNNFTTFMPVGSSWIVNGQQIMSATTTSPFLPGLNTRYFNQTSSLLYSGMPISSTYVNKGELVKLRYNFSPATTFTASYLGSQTWTEQNGNHVYLDPSIFNPGAAYFTQLGPQPGQLIPVEDNVFLPAHEWEINNEPIFQGEVRTTFRNNNILARAYSASISRLQYNGLNSPTQAGGISNVQVFGTASVCPVGYKAGTGANAGKCVPPGGGAAVAPTTQAFNGTPATLVNPSAYFNDSEEDRLHGYSLEIDHPFGDSGNFLSLADDWSSSVTGKYQKATFVPGGANTATVPPTSGEKYNTLLLRYIGNLGPRAQVTFSNYFNSYLTHYSTNNGATFIDQHNSHYDARLGLTYRAQPDLSLRASAGSAIAPPYIGLYSRTTTAPVIDKSGLFATNTEANPNLRPETSFGYDLGADLRTGGDRQTVISGDLYWTNLWNQLISTSQYFNGVAQVKGLPLGGNGQGTGPLVTVPLVSSGSTNLAKARYEGIEVSIRRDPPVGFGFTVQGALQHATPVDVPLAFYTAAGSTVPVRNLGVVPGPNFFGGSQGVSNQSIPYSQGYFEIRYRTPRGGLLSFGDSYTGNNNSLFVPAFWIANANAIFPLTHGFTLNVNVDNAFNTLGNPTIIEYGGIVQPYIPGAMANINGSLVPVSGALLNANSYGPRNVRISLGYKVGG